jgi:conjugal transfer/type IV secretion protein DotA/TraY
MADTLDVVGDPVSSTDMSGQILDLLFGPNWDSLSQIVSGSGGEAILAGASLLLSILSALTLVALSIGSLIMTYTIFMGVIGTAHEGQPLGKKLPTLWTPVRGALAVGLMIPSAKGLSVMMVMLLVSIGYSISFSNYLLGKGVEYLRANSGQVVVRVPESEISNSEDLAATILTCLAAQQHIRMRSGRTFSQTYKVVSPSEKDPNYIIQFQAPTHAHGIRTKHMGSVVIPCTEGSGDAICKARKDGIVAMIESLEPNARAVVANNMSDDELAESGESTDRTINEATIRDAVKAYSVQVASVVPQIINDEDSEFQTGLNEFLDQALTDGWLALGSYYWTFSRYAEMSHKASNALPQATGPNGDALRYLAEDDPQFFNSISNASEVVDNAVETRVSAARSGGKSERAAFRKISRYFYSGFGMVGAPFGLAAAAVSSDTAQYGQDWVIKKVAQNLTEKDPVATLSNWGHATVTAAEYVWGAYVVGKAIAAGAQATATGIWADTFSGGVAGGIAAGLKDALQSFMIPVLMILTPLYLCGLMLAYYLPALPWILWTGAVIGWLLLVCETLAAAPFWTVGIMIPEGDGLAGQHGRQGIMMLLGILARPPLMVAGFFFAMVLMVGVGKFLGMSFLIFYGSSSAERLPSITACLAYTFILGSVVVVFAHKIFGLITHLPENVIKWIGGGVASLGEHQDEDRLRAIFMGGGRKMMEGIEGSNSNPTSEPKGRHGDGWEAGVSSITKKLDTGAGGDNSHD